MPTGTPLQPLPFSTKQCRFDAGPNPIQILRNLTLSASPLPPSVAIHHGSYVLRKNRTRIHLCRVTAGEAAMRSALAQISIASEARPATYGELFDRYKATAQAINIGLANKAPATRKQYIDMIDRFLAPGFGAMSLGSLTAGMVTKYLTMRHSGKIVAPNKKDPKRGVTAAANRERAVLSAVLTYAVNNDWLPDGNVVKATVKFKEKARERSVTSEEMTIAKNVVPAWWADYFDFLYLTGMRGQDARAVSSAGRAVDS
jgi:hypothetical protein